MPTYFHIDRGNRLQVGATVGLRGSSMPWFPGGVSHHGDWYLRSEAFEIKIPGLDGSDHFAVDRNVGLELAWELMRLNEFSSAPSRFQSMFAFESLKEARQCKILGGGDGTIWEVETDLPGFRADMSLLHTHPKIDGTLQLARIYWSQLEDYDRSNLPPECGPPVWEVLLTAPVRVVRLVT